MVRRLAVLLLMLVLPAAALLVARPAAADARVSIAVLSIESDDAEDQAEALTQALRSRLRASSAFQVVEVNQSLGTLMGAMRCGKNLDGACQGKIADLLKVERLVWGRMAKSPNREVMADLHLYQKGKGETPVREGYSDNLKDPNDDALRKVAQRILDRLMGVSPGFAVIKGNASEVVVDGSKRLPLNGGAARVDLPPGAHVLELSGKGLKAQKREVTITAGQEVPVAVTLAAETAPTPIGPGPVPVEPEPDKTSTRKIVGYSLMGVGAAGVITGGVFGGIYFSKSSKQSSLNEKFPSNAGDACDYYQGNAPGSGASKGAAKDACDNAKAGEKAGSIAWVVGGVGAAVLGVGAYFAFTGDPQDKEKAAVKGAGMRVTPAVGRDGGGVLVLGQF